VQRLTLSRRSEFVEALETQLAFERDEIAKGRR